MKVVDKPWGREIWWAHAKDKYMGKILEINAGERLSLQFHIDKDETIYVTKGSLKLYYAERLITLRVFSAHLVCAISYPLIFTKISDDLTL